MSDRKMLAEGPIRALNEAIAERDAEAAVACIDEVMRVLVLACVSRRDTGSGLTVRTLTEPAYKLRERCGTEWAEVRGRLEGLRELARLVDDAVHSRMKEDDDE